MRGAGEDSYWDLTTSSTSPTFRINAVADSAAFAEVSQLAVPCYGAGDTASDTWNWTVAMRVERDDQRWPLGTPTDVDVSLSIPDWYRTLGVFTDGDTDAKVHATVDFYFVGPNGPIPARTLSLDNAEYRSALGISSPDDWSASTGSWRIEGMRVGHPPQRENAWPRIRVHLRFRRCPSGRSYC